MGSQIVARACDPEAFWWIRSYDPDVPPLFPYYLNCISPSCLMGRAHVYLGRPHTNHTGQYRSEVAQILSTSGRIFAASNGDVCRRRVQMGWDKELAL